MSAILESLRQRLFPREFRIGQPAIPDDWLEQMGRLTEALERENSEVSQPPLDLSFLADVGTGLWRLRQRMLIPGGDRPKEEFRREYRHLEAIWDVLEQAGLRIQSHDGEPYAEGLALRVVSQGVAPGLSRPRISETVRPSIFFRGDHIQMGQVIVETPEASS